MAKLSELVPVMAKALGIEKKSVNVAAMHLRKTGWISKSGRGTAGAEMQPNDASNLLIAMLAAEQLKDAPDKVRFYREATTNLKIDEMPPHPGLLGLGDRHCFGDALDVLISDVAETGGLSHAESEFPFTNWALGLKRRHYMAELYLDDGSRTWEVYYGRSHPDFDDVHEDRLNEAAREVFGRIGDMELEATITNRTFYAIGECIGETSEQQQTTVENRSNEGSASAK